jgi:peroxiredoxin
MNSRSSFIIGAIGAGLTASLQPARALTGGGARSGPYCLPLRKGVAQRRFDFELDVLDGGGKTFKLSSQLGSAVWLNFFASWCGPCNDEAGRVVELAERYKAHGLVTVGIDVDEKPESARTFRDRHAVPFPIALDSKGIVFNGFGFEAIPTHLFFDRNGLITCLVPQDLSEREIDNEIAVALGVPSLHTPAPQAMDSPAPQATDAPPPQATDAPTAQATDAPTAQASPQPT